MIRKFRHWFAPALVALVSGMAAETTAATILVDTLDGYLTGSSLNVGDLSGQSFQTTSTDYIVDSVSLEIYRDANQLGGSFDVFLYSAKGNNEPDSQVAVIAQNQSIDALPDGDGVQVAPTVYGGLNLALSTSSTYYVIVEVTSTGSGSQFFWRYWNTTTPNIPYTTYNATSGDNGSSWTTPNLGYPYMIKVTAVPEPSSIALGLVACAGLAVAQRRRKQA